MIYLSSKFYLVSSNVCGSKQFFSMRLHLGHEALKNMQCSGLEIRGISFVGYGGVQNCFELRLCRLFLRSDALYLWDDSSSLIGRVIHS